MEPLESLQWAAAILGLTYQQTCSLARQGIIPVVRVGRQYRVNPATLRKWIETGGQSYESGWRKQAN